jgi:RNA polymerase sigma factor (sigma-70 family)
MMSRRKDVDVLALDEALNHLAKMDPRQSRVVELRFFAGLSLEQISEVLEIAPATVQRDWTAARAWLHREISRNSRV